ncbi:MAG: hypothetical protein WA941_01740 [Nitrososphaeraceae archaeon]
MIKPEIVRITGLIRSTCVVNQIRPNKLIPIIGVGGVLDDGILGQEDVREVLQKMQSLAGTNDLTDVWPHQVDDNLNASFTHHLERVFNGFVQIREYGIIFFVCS